MESKSSSTFHVSDNEPKKYRRVSSESHARQIACLRPYREGGCKEILQMSQFPPNTDLSGRNFVEVVVDAYSDHHNLVIRPDDVWAAIMTQFSYYINKNAEKFRGKFVAFGKDKKTLTVFIDGSIRAGNDLFVKRMTEKIHENLIDPEVKDWILPNFSTTTDNDVVTIGVIFMATMKKYFNYRRAGCGLPNVTLEGTTEDWKAVLARLEKLKDYELEKWYDLLKPVVQQFVDAKEGKVDLDFWQRICTYKRNSSATSYLSGWITVFCVFDKDGNWRESEWDKREDRKLQEWLRFDIKTVPFGLVKVDVVVVDPADDVEHNCLMIAGHMGAEVKQDGVTLQPTLGWAFALMSKDKSETPPSKDEFWRGYYT